MEKHPFLSDTWFIATEALLADETFDAPASVPLTLNVIVEETPFSEDVRIFVGSREGKAHWGRGHADDADMSLATDYETARTIFITGDAALGMSAFFAGKVRLQGDLSKFIEAVTAAGGPAGALGLVDPALAEKLQAITQ